jgi:hypothetical protein
VGSGIVEQEKKAKRHWLVSQRTKNRFISKCAAVSLAVAREAQPSVLKSLFLSHVSVHT